MSIRGSFIFSLLGVIGYASTAFANSCANVDVMGTFDESVLREWESGIYAAGTFRIAEEENEAKQSSVLTRPNGGGNGWNGSSGQHRAPRWPLRCWPKNAKQLR
jgi:hypothetical protein